MAAQHGRRRVSWWPCSTPGSTPAHPEFAGRLVPGFDVLTGVEPTARRDFGPTNDDDGHGTHVSGTVAAAANNGQGIAGIAPNVSIMPIKILDATGSGDFEGMVAGMNWAIGHGARIITMSLGGTLSSPGIATCRRRSMPRTRPACRGRGGVGQRWRGRRRVPLQLHPRHLRRLDHPGRQRRQHVLDPDRRRWPWWRPANSIVSALPGNQYGYGSGTSMATPHVTGAVALMRSVDPSISVDQVIADLTQTARPLVAGRSQSRLRLRPAAGWARRSTAPRADPARRCPRRRRAERHAHPGRRPDPDGRETPTPDPAISPTPTPTPVATPAPVPPSLLGRDAAQRDPERAPLHAAPADLLGPDGRDLDHGRSR